MEEREIKKEGKREWGKEKREKKSERNGEGKDRERLTFFCVLAVCLSRMARLKRVSTTFLRFALTVFVSPPFFSLRERGPRNCDT